MEDVLPGGSAERPLFVRWVSGDDGKVKWGRIVLALTLTAVTAYLSVAIQRGMSGPDVVKTIKMRGAALQLQYAKKRISHWEIIAMKAQHRYDMEVL